MIGGVSSGSGKTLITCGLLQVFRNRKLKAVSFKCGPDYIDPMFHKEVIGVTSRNLDSFFTDQETLRFIFGKTAKNADVSVIEGVMGFYDGLGGIVETASSYDVAKITDTPVILVVNCKGMSVSILPLIKGFLEYEKDSHIAGVILNQMSKGLYPEIKNLIEETLSIKVFGYVPLVKELVIESRHLGLVTPDELENLHEKLNRLADVLEETLEIDSILGVTKETSDLSYKEPFIPRIKENPVIGIAIDEAFCFYYEDNLELLEQMGASLVYFSPLHDDRLPEGIQGLILGGGYPELYARKLSENKTMRESIKNALDHHLPCLGECGGFMYLHETMEDMEGNTYPMVGTIKGGVYRTSKLSRFGYINLTSKEEQMIAHKGESIKGHEFHYFESDNLGESYVANKPLRKRSWNCIHGNEHLAVGFPHLYYYSNVGVAYRFLEKCGGWQKPI